MRAKIQFRTLTSFLFNVIIRYLKGRPKLKNRIIRISIRIKLHKIALRVYATTIAFSRIYHPNWLISEKLDEVSFKASVTKNISFIQEENKDFENEINRKSSRTIILKEPRVAILCSIYRSETYLENFLLNLVNQDYFASTEPCFVVCDPSEYELERLSKFVGLFRNCRLNVSKKRIGIYTAWNLALTMSDAPLITNMNVDDTRRDDSIRRQVEILTNNTFIDVAYQDVYVSLVPHLPWDLIQKICPISKLPSVSYAGLLAGVNSPHNAPMWRRNLHVQHGEFDEAYRTAGDYDFWLKCALAGSLFLKDRQAHVSYYLNSQGLSTGPSSLGVKEMFAIQEKYLKREADYSNFDLQLAGMAMRRISTDSLTARAIINLSGLKKR